MGEISVISDLMLMLCQDEPVERDPVPARQFHFSQCPKMRSRQMAVDMWDSDESGTEWPTSYSSHCQRSDDWRLSKPNKRKISKPPDYSHFLSLFWKIWYHKVSSVQQWLENFTNSFCANSLKSFHCVSSWTWSSSTLLQCYHKLPHQFLSRSFCFTFIV